MELQVINRESDAVAKISVAEHIASAPDKPYVVWEVVRWWQACRRRGTHATKTRAEVRGGGRKPWTQKGTGRARHGSIRSPLWNKGGVAHGPKPRDYAYPIPKKKKKLAWRIVLADRIRSGRVLLLDELSADEPKTKAGVRFLERLGFEPGAVKILLIDLELERNALLSLRNIPGVDLVPLKHLNIYHLLYYDALVFTRAAYETFERMCRP